jgi:hypothetical protein
MMAGRVMRLDEERAHIMAVSDARNTLTEPVRSLRGERDKHRSAPYVRSTGKSSLTTSAKSVGVGAAYQRLILAGARSLLLMRTATTGSVWL